MWSSKGARAGGGTAIRDSGVHVHYRYVQIKSIKILFHNSPPLDLFTIVLSLLQKMWQWTSLCFQLSVSQGFFLKYELLKLSLPSQRKGSFIRSCVLTACGWRNPSKMIPWPKGRNSNARWPAVSFLCLLLGVWPFAANLCSAVQFPGHQALVTLFRIAVLNRAKRQLWQ